jgi:hypothetical protein
MRFRNVLSWSWLGASSVVLGCGGGTGGGASGEGASTASTASSATSQPAGAVRQTNAVSSSSVESVSGALREAPIAGSILAVTVFANTASSVTEVSGGGVATWRAGPNGEPAYGTMVTYWGVVETASIATITARFAGQVAFAEMYIVEATGVTQLDTTGIDSGTGTTPTVPTLKLSGAGDVVVAQTWIEGGSVTAVADHGFVDSFAPDGLGPGVFQSYALLGAATSYTPESYTAPKGVWSSQAIAFKRGTTISNDAGASPPPATKDAGSQKKCDAGAATPPTTDAAPPDCP